MTAFAGDGKDIELVPPGTFPDHVYPKYTYPATSPVQLSGVFAGLTLDGAFDVQNSGTISYLSFGGGSFTNEVGGVVYYGIDVPGGGLVSNSGTFTDAVVGVELEEVAGEIRTDR